MQASIAAALLAILPVCFAASEGEPAGDPQSGTGGAKAAHLEAGRKLADLHCAACHAIPAPDLLDKATWREQTMPRMAFRMGLFPATLERYPDAEQIRAAGVIPNAPMVSLEDFERIAAYYVEAAPEARPSQSPREPIRVGLKHFAFEPVRFRHAPPSTTLVHISRPTRRIYFGDDQSKTLTILNSGGELIDSVNVGNVPVALTETARGVYVTMIGRFIPSEEPLGGLVFLGRTSQSFELTKAFLTKTPRMTDTVFADVNHDGKADMVTSYFGYFTGRFSWHENLGMDRFREHVLFPKAGAVRSVVHDFNGDGFRDIGVLIAQETESFFIFVNDGKGEFASHTIFEKPPTYGHTHFEVVDFNRDGQADLLVSNGDVGDYRSPPRGYHGIRLYLNRGGLHFQESRFFPLNGTFKAVARDFDNDGDLDIAAISFFPDYQGSPEESFVYFENLGTGEFSASTFGECRAGRWLTMDAGDVDADGDLDIVLGSYIRGPGNVPEPLVEKWELSGPSVVILRNTLR